MTLYHPWRDLGDRYPGVSVEYDILEEGVDAWAELEAHLIVMDRRLNQVQRRCTLAHEIAHLDRGDRCLHETYPDARRLEHKMEEAAHAEAARRLIDGRDLARAFAIWGDGDFDSVADELWVDLDTLVARLDHLHPAERGQVRRALDAREDAA